MTKVYAWVDIDSQLRSRLKDITHSADEPGWQGLTDDDVNEITKDVIAFKSDVVAFIREAEAKLKEKNT